VGIRKKTKALQSDCMGANLILVINEDLGMLPGHLEKVDADVAMFLPAL
jgi:hypothetical protein